MRGLLLEQYDIYVYCDKQKGCYNNHKSYWWSYELLFSNNKYASTFTECLEKGRTVNYRFLFVVKV